MKINQRDTAIDCFHTIVHSFSGNQEERVLSSMSKGEDYSLSELMEMVDIDKSSMSRVVNGLRKKGLAVCAPKRQCTITGVMITPTQLPFKQGELF